MVRWYTSYKKYLDEMATGLYYVHVHTSVKCA